MTPYILRETIISMAINTAFSLGFFLVVFGMAPVIPMRGLGAYAFDFLPQSFAIALMSTVIPGAIAAKRVRSRAIPRWQKPGRLPRPLPLRAVVMAAIGLAVGGVVCAALLALGPVAIGWWPALVAKLAYGGVLAGVVTPPALRAAMR